MVYGVVSPSSTEGNALVRSGTSEERKSQPLLEHALWIWEPPFWSSLCHCVAQFLCEDPRTLLSVSFCDEPVLVAPTVDPPDGEPESAPAEPAEANVDDLAVQDSQPTAEGLASTSAPVASSSLSKPIVSSNRKSDPPTLGGEPDFCQNCC